VPDGPVRVRDSFPEECREMKRLTWVATGLAMLTGLALMLPPSSAADKDSPSIKEIMTKAHKGGDSLIGKLGTELKADDPDWAKVQEQTKDLVELGAALGKNTPPKGDKESWEKLTTAYEDNAKDMDKAAQKKDKETTAADLKKVMNMCMNCHKVHKPN
jgi:hypothetical protein